MMQMIVTLEPGADSSLLRKMIENMKGVGSVFLKKDYIPTSKVLNNEMSVGSATDENVEEWIAEMRNLSNTLNSNLIDKNDERTQYILSR